MRIKLLLQPPACWPKYSLPGSLLTCEAELESSYKDCFNLLKPQFSLEQARVCFKLHLPNCAYKKSALSTINYKSPQPVHPTTP